MKRLCTIGMLLLICFIAACGNATDNSGQSESATGETPVNNETAQSTEESIASGQTTEATEYVSPYATKEISRDGAYKTMEMYVYEDVTDERYLRRITFEVPVEWVPTDSVVVGHSMKVDMFRVYNATREQLLKNFDENITVIEEEGAEIICENNYLTENYEVFYRKSDFRMSSFGMSVQHAYYLYANGEYTGFSGWNFVEDTPEHDEIFRRIAESIRFQF